MYLSENIKPSAFSSPVFASAAVGRRRLGQPRAGGDPRGSGARDELQRGSGRLRHTPVVPRGATGRTPPEKKKINKIHFLPRKLSSPPLGVNSGEGRGGGAGPAGPREAWSPPGPCSLAAGRGASGALGGRGGWGKPPASSSGAALRGGALRARGGGGLAGPRSDGGCRSKRG